MIIYLKEVITISHTSMSLVPSSQQPAGRGFETKGSLDWVAVSNTTFSASVACLGQLASPGLQPLAVQIARAIGIYIPISSDGETRLNEATSRMKSFPAAGKLIWFGCGVQHIFQTLLETSQGK